MRLLATLSDPKDARREAVRVYHAMRTNGQLAVFHSRAGQLSILYWYEKGYKAMLDRHPDKLVGVFSHDGTVGAVEISDAIIAHLGDTLCQNKAA